MAPTLLYEGLTAIDTVTSTIPFNDVSMVIFETPELPVNEGYEIACNLGIYVDINNEIILREYSFNDLNIVDTNEILLIPNQFVNNPSGLIEVKLNVLTSESIELKIWGL